MDQPSKDLQFLDSKTVSAKQQIVNPEKREALFIIKLL